MGKGRDRYREKHGRDPEKSWETRLWDEAELGQRAAETERVTIAIDLIRANSRIWSVALEHRHFPPDTALNNALDVEVLRWPAGPDSHHWQLVRIPIGSLPTAVKVAAEFDLEVVEAMPFIAVYGPRLAIQASTKLNPEEQARLNLPPGWQHLLAFPIPPGPGARSIESRKSPMNLLGAEAREQIARENWLIEQELEASYRRQGLPWDPEEVRRRIDARSEGIMADMDRVEGREG